MSEEWNTPVLTNVPEEGDAIEFECCGLSCRGRRRGNILVSDSGQQWTALIEGIRWRRLPPNPRLLPQFVIDAYRHWVNGTDNRPFTAALGELFDPSRSPEPYLIVVDGECHIDPGADQFIALLESRLSKHVEIEEGLDCEIKRLREQMKAREEAVERIIGGFTCCHDCEKCNGYIAAYRKLTQEQPR